MFTEILIAFFLFFLYYWNSDYRRIKNGLSRWVPVVPGLPIFGNALDCKKPTDIINAFVRYTKENGDLFLITFFSQILLVADYKLTEFVLSSNKIITRSSNYDYLRKWLSSGLLLSTGEKWKKRRHAITPSFHFQVVEQFVEVFDRGSNVLVKKLESEVGKESTDIHSYISLCALDNICETAMGVSVNAQEKSNSTYVKAVTRLCEIIVQRNFSLLKLTNFTYPLTSDFWEERRLTKIVHNFTNSVIEAKREKRKGINNKNDEETNEVGIKKRVAFLDTLFDIEIDGKPLTNEDIREEVNVFMFAGHDTLSTGAAFTLYCLSRHPEIQQRVFDEQQSIFCENNKRAMTWSDVQEMKYLEQVIKESLRMYPPIPIFGRVVTEDMQYQDNLIPKGTTISLNAFCMHRNSKFYPDPEKFDPDRFDASNDRVPAYAYIPFGAGPRNCIGQRYAMIEMKTIISAVLRSFKVCEVKGHEPILRDDMVLKSDNGVKVRLEKRN